jgi:hypothetical protein
MIYTGGTSIRVERIRSEVTKSDKTQPAKTQSTKTELSMNLMKDLQTPCKHLGILSIQKKRIIEINDSLLPLNMTEGEVIATNRSSCLRCKHYELITGPL